MKILVIDVGGNNLKLLASGQPAPRKVPSGPGLTAARMAASVRKAVADWRYDAVAIGFPGPVKDGHPAEEPVNLGGGWVRFDYAKAFGKPVKVVNDAVMQALGSYRGGRMLFIGLGTGLGAALVLEGLVQPLEIAHLSYRSGKTYEEFLGKGGLLRMGKKRWRGLVAEIVPRLREAFQVDEVVLGGGNVKLLRALPAGCRPGSNANAFDGGFRLWESGRARQTRAAPATKKASPRRAKASRRHAR